jgi:hypothetical protein
MRNTPITPLHLKVLLCLDNEPYVHDLLSVYAGLYGYNYQPFNTVDAFITAVEQNARMQDTNFKPFYITDTMGYRTKQDALRGNQTQHGKETIDTLLGLGVDIATMCINTEDVRGFYPVAAKYKGLILLPSKNNIKEILSRQSAA